MGKQISIIIATYNAEKTLNRCLNSIIQQKAEQIELIIVDGGSIDKTLDIIKENGKYIDRYISEKDHGLYDAWNKGIKLSSGKWIEFLGSDDILLPGAINKLLIISKKYPDVEIISGKAKLVDTHGVFIKDMGESYDAQVFKKRMNISHGSTLHNRKIFDEIGLFDINFKICGDYELLLRKTFSSKFINEYIIQMQTGGMSTTLKARKDAYRARKKNKVLSPFANWLMGCREFMGYIVKKTLRLDVFKYIDKI